MKVATNSKRMSAASKKTDAEAALKNGQQQLAILNKGLQTKTGSGEEIQSAARSNFLVQKNCLARYWAPMPCQKAKFASNCSAYLQQALTSLDKRPLTLDKRLQVGLCGKDKNCRVGCLGKLNVNLSLIIS